MAQISSISNGEALSSVRTKLNSVITEINLLDPTDWTDYSATSTIVGWSSYTTKLIYYRIIGKQVFVNFQLAGTSNSTSVTFTLPNNNNATFTSNSLNTLITDNGTNSNTSGRLNTTASSNVITLAKDRTGTVFTSTGTKSVSGQFFYFID
jgi:hypothetical protein